MLKDTLTTPPTPEILRIVTMNGPERTKNSEISARAANAAAKAAATSAAAVAAATLLHRETERQRLLDHQQTFSCRIALLRAAISGTLNGYTFSPFSLPSFPKLSRF